MRRTPSAVFAVAGLVLAVAPVGFVGPSAPVASASTAPVSSYAPTAFRHPGVLVNQAQLDFIKAKVAAGADPWLTAFNQANTSASGSLTYVPHPWATVSCGSASIPNDGCTDERGDAMAAYTHALLWYITGNVAHAQKAVEIMNAWSSTLKGGHQLSNAPLQSGWSGTVWPEAAEIIRYTYTGWASADVAAFRNLLITQYEPYLVSGSCKNGNWELVMTSAMMNISVFTDDPVLFDKAVGFWKERVPAYMYLSSDGPTPMAPTDCPGINVPGLWNQSRFVDGLAQETARDLGHTFWGMGGAVDAAETALQQGVDLYSLDAQRMVAAYEFNDGILNGVPVPAGVHVGGRSGIAPAVYANGATLEIVYNELHNRLGMAMPQTEAQIAKRRPTNEDHFMVWETLTHAEVGFVGLQGAPPPPGPPGAPSAVTGTASGGGTVSLAWTGPADSGGAPVTYYVVYAYSNTAPAQETVVAAGTSASLSGLTPAAYYTFIVSAYNGVGWSAWSGWSAWLAVT